MAYIQTDIYLHEISRTLPVHLYFPTDLSAEVGNKVHGVITLLHGLGGSGEQWMTMSAACRYAADNGYILVAPNADNSFYTDMAYGPAFYTALTEYLPRELEKIFAIPTAQELNFLAGLSMGGYGALKLGLRNPQRWAAIGSFSGVVDLAYALKHHNDPMIQPVMQSVLGAEALLPDELNLYRLAEQAAMLPAKQRPRLFCTCGKQDELFDMYIQNQRFAQHVKALPLDFTFQSWDGVHEWNFWDRSLAEFIGFIQNSDYGARKRNDWTSKADIL